MADVQTQVYITIAFLRSRSPLTLLRSAQDDEWGDHEPSAPPTNANLPRIIWGHDGETIMGVDPASESIIWSRKVDSVVAAMYGVVGDKWVDVDIVQEPPPTSEDPRSNGNNVVVEYRGDQWAKVRMGESGKECRDDNDPHIEQIPPLVNFTFATRTQPKKILPTIPLRSSRRMLSTFRVCVSQGGTSLSSQGSGWAWVLRRFASTTVDQGCPPTPRTPSRTPMGNPQRQAIQMGSSMGGDFSSLGKWSSGSSYFSPGLRGLLTSSSRGDGGKR